VSSRRFRFGRDTSSAIRDERLAVRIHLVIHETSTPLFAHQPGAAQHCQVPGHDRLADLHAFAQRAGVHAAARRLLEDGAAGRVGQGLEEPFSIIPTGKQILM
jgi:hypothetical protein